MAIDRLTRCNSGKHLFIGKRCQKCVKERHREAYEREMRDPDLRAKRLENSLRWQRNNPDRVADRRHRRRAREKAVQVTLTPDEWDAILAWHSSPEGTRCAYCFSVCTPTLDHIVPVSKGGPHAADNVVPACRPCNSSKGAKELAAWA